ncbi:MAG: hypothetical protein RBU29_05475 [bacterium]|jgi:hypothetical protein|nr:hypothetical protein [bacterium]
MSKRHQEYKDGLERLCEFLDILLREKEIPTPQEVKAELDSIQALRSVHITLRFPRSLLELKEGYFFLISEEFARYDDIYPEYVDIYAYPAEMDDPKKLDRLTMAL